MAENNIKDMIKFEIIGKVTKIITSNNQHIKFEVESKDNKGTKKNSIVSFDKLVITTGDKMIGRRVHVKGKLYKDNYKNKSTGKWINDYTLQSEEIRSIKE